MRLPNKLLAVLVVLAGAGAAHAQDRIFIDVETNLPEALVFADTALVGPVAGGVLAVPAGTEAVRLVAPGFSAWSVPPVEAPLRGLPGDTVALRIDFPYHYHIESTPFGADVHLETAQGWEKLGETPFHYASETPLQGKLVVQEPGYVLQRLEPGRKVWNPYQVNLSPEVEADPEAARIAWTPPGRHRSWIDYAAIGTALVAGAVAVHYKFKADRLYDDYVDTTDPALRSQIKQYDTYSAVALGTMQVGVGVFAIRLALR